VLFSQDGFPPESCSVGLEMPEENKAKNNISQLKVVRLNLNESLLPIHENVFGLFLMTYKDNTVNIKFVIFFKLVCIFSIFIVDDIYDILRSRNIE